MILLFKNAASEICPFLNVRSEARSSKGGNFFASHVRNIAKRNKTIYSLSGFSIINAVPSSKGICEIFCSESERY